MQPNIRQIVQITLSGFALIAGPCFSQDQSDEMAETAMDHPVERVSVDPRAQDMQALAASAAPEEVRWLEVGGEKVLALYAPALGDRKGAVLMLHAQGEHPDWPGPLANLRRYLPDKGWDTFSLALPNPAPVLPPPRPEPVAKPDPDREETEEIYDDANNALTDGSVKPESAPGKKPENIEAATLEQVAAAMDFLIEQGVEKIAIYSQGMGTVRAMHYLEKRGNTDGRIQALVFFNSYNRVPNLDITADRCLAKNTLPVLDLLSTNTANLTHAAKARSHQAKLSGQRLYQQQFVPPFAGSAALNKKVYGFLKRYF